MAVKLVGLTFGAAPRIAGIRSGDLIAIDVDKPTAALKDWRISIRGQTVLFISPPGWTPASATVPSKRDPKGPCVVHEVPRAEVFLQWESDGDVDAIVKGIAKYDTQPLGWMPAPVASDKPILAQIPAGQVGDA